MQNLVAIVGRPNVGKSSLFNKLVGKRQSIVHDQPGVTRDRLYGDVEWTGKKFQIIDTGGIEIKDRPFQDQIKIQAKIAIEEAQVIVLVLDGSAALTSDDHFIVDILRKSSKQVVVVANKLEGNREIDPSIWTTGVGNVFNISAIHGEGVGDMLDEVVSHLEFDEDKSFEGKKLAIIGRPNAGKSSLLNALIGENRSIVSEISGTTRDSVNAKFSLEAHDFLVIDTAGINRKSKLIDSIDHYSLSRAMNSINNSDIVLLMIDQERDLAHFDSVVGGYAFEKQKPTIIIVNKWDLAEKETMTMKRREQEIRDKFKFLSWAPIVFISAKTLLRLDKLKVKIKDLIVNTERKIKTRLLNEIINEIQVAQPSKSYRGGRLNLKFVKQIDSRIPTFIFWVNNIRYLHFSYKRFLDNQLREYFDFEGTPINLIFRDSKEESRRG